MQKWTRSRLTAAASLLLLTGCVTTPIVNDTCPAPVFPSCHTINDAARQGAPDSVFQDWVRVDNVMLKLRERQGHDEQQKFAKCAIDKPGAGAKSILRQPKPANIEVLQKLQDRFTWVQPNPKL